jgi:hypothetical protein
MWTARQRWYAEGCRRRRQAAIQLDLSALAGAFVTFQGSRSVVLFIASSIGNLPALASETNNLTAMPFRLVSPGRARLNRAAGGLVL